MNSKHLPYLILAALSVILSFGLSEFYPFWKSLSICIPILSIFGYIYYKKTVVEDEILQPYVTLIQEQENSLVEQLEVISEYEKILDTQFTTIECDCKEGHFDGFFENNVENLVKCDKCGNHYKVTVNYNAVLVSDVRASDEIFDEITKNIEKTEEVIEK